MYPWMQDDLEQRRAAGLYRVRRRLQSAQGPRVQLRGREFVNFTSNDYLGYAADPRLARAAARAAKRYGCGAGASALVSGWSPPLRALERDLARWEGTEAALVLTSGFAANLAVVGTLAGRADAVFSDAWNHASLIDGCRLSRAAVHVYHHADLDHLTELLQSEDARPRRQVANLPHDHCTVPVGQVCNLPRRFLVTDTVFSMDGDVAPLAGLIELAERFDCFLLVDEAHATGVLGDQGRGATDLLPATAALTRVIKVGTLSKALGSQGGFICGSRSLIDWLVNHARPYIFSTALAPPVAAAGRRALALVQREPERRRHVLRLADIVRDRLRSAGLKVGPSCCQIVPVIIGDPGVAVSWSRRLEERGFLVSAIRPPSVPDGTSRLRISLTAGHSEADVSALADAILGCPERSISQSV